MRISAAFGHGEGVVGNRDVATESVICLQSRAFPGQIYTIYDSAYKPQRLAPVREKEGGKVALQLIDNGPELAADPVFSDGMIMRLFGLATAVEEHYQGKPTDMELVIKGDVIYPVQARPVNRKPVLPTYFDKNLFIENHPDGLEGALKGKCLVSGSSLTTIVNDRNELLIRDTLETAEEDFDPAQHKIVVVRKDEPALSHPVVNFSGMGVPCLYIERAGEPPEVFAAGQKLVVCMQSQTLYAVKGLEEPAQFIKKGYVSHPAYLRISLGSSGKPFPDGRERGLEKLQELMERIKGAAIREVALKSLKEFEKLAKEEFKIDRLLELKGRVAKNATKEGKNALEAVDRLELKIRWAIKELEEALKAERAERPEILFHAKVVETLAFSKEPGQLSLIHLDALLNEAQQATAYQEQCPVRAQLVQELGYRRHCLMEKTAVNWKWFLLSLEGKLDEEKRGRFKKMMKTLEECGALSGWMTLFFAPSRTKHHADPLKTVDALLELFDCEVESALSQLLEWKRKIAAAEERQSAFGDPDKFGEAFDALRNLARDFSEELFRLFKQAAPLTDLAALPLMNRMVDLYDGSIKCLKAGAARYEGEAHRRLFRKMVEGYFILLKDWSLNLAGEGAFKFCAVSYEVPSTLSGYLNNIGMAFDGMRGNGPEQLRRSSGFRVNTAVLGSGANILRHQPKTLEDFFMLVHQNLNAVTATLIKRAVDEKELKRLELPPKIQELIRAVRKTRKELSLGAVFREVAVTPELLNISYTVPLANHSSTATLVYNKKENKTGFEGKLLGQARTRWDEMVFCFQLYSVAGLFPLAEPPERIGDELCWRWEVPQELSAEKLLLAYHRMIHHTELDPVMLEDFKNLCEKKGPSAFRKAEQWVLQEFIKGNCEKLQRKAYYPFLSRPLMKLCGSRPLMALKLLAERCYFWPKGIETAVNKLAPEQVLEAAAPLLGKERRTKEESEILFELFIQLLKKGEGYDEAEKFFSLIDYRNFSSAYSVTSEDAINRFIAELAKNKVALGLFKQKAANAIAVKTEVSQVFACWLYMLLLQNGEAVDEAKTSASPLLQSPNKDVAAASLKLYHALVEKGEALEEAASAVKAKLFSGKMDAFSYGNKVHLAAETLLAKLFEHFEKENPLLQGLQSWLADTAFSEGDFCWSAYHLLKKSFDIGHINSEVCQKARKVIETGPLPSLMNRTAYFGQHSFLAGENCPLPE